MTFEEQLASLKSPIKARLRIEDAAGTVIEIGQFHEIAIAVSELNKPTPIPEEGGWEVVPRFNDD